MLEMERQNSCSHDLSSQPEFKEKKKWFQLDLGKSHEILMDEDDDGHI